MKYYFAPMEGITTHVFRAVHSRRFPGADRYYTPFFSPTSDHLFTPRELRELTPETPCAAPVVPQILSKCAADIVWAVEGLQDMGYTVFNLNLGCPSATVTGKGQGRGASAKAGRARHAARGCVCRFAHCRVAQKPHRVSCAGGISAPSVDLPAI